MAASAAGLFAAAALTLTVSAEDYIFDVSEAVQTNGDWGQSFVYYTCNDGNHEGNFDATWITSDSEVLVEYTYEGERYSKPPVEIIWQTWEDGPVAPDPDVNRSWNKVAPYEFDETSAKFSFEDIVASYGTDNFATVYAINVGDTGVKLTVTALTITNCDIPGEISETEEDAEEETETETETEKVTEKETEAAAVKETASETEAVTTEATTNIADNAPKEGGSGAVAVTVIIIVIVVAAAAVGVYFMVKNNKGKYY